jgi:hypothetical protein
MGADLHAATIHLKVSTSRHASATLIERAADEGMNPEASLTSARRWRADAETMVEGSP